ncbi:hypothetical protein J416_03971 [Gracilibacillus halophilus YIM-C55.5]|uniref:Prolipoprotein diacylglyceryl transferase n=1 Tax=Gracilibacillus halophilus YIM-C55.5 TaxID=1308866 RepID=N4WNI1_9BACI|nr:hypothetical protein [Gracilibacillus halophilus]ENH97692.1 hypothetical protein J416_03971 [Gracilibacillus halophilus YIM-C55.5]
MPPAWVFGPFIVKVELVLIAISIALGVIVFLFIRPFSKNEMKQRMDEIFQLLLTFMICLWLGKILFHWSTFIEDPVAILAYPSNSQAFYVGILLTAVYSRWRITSHMDHVTYFQWLFSWLFVFIASSFVYQFIQISIENDGNGLYLSLLVMLLVGALFSLQRASLYGITSSLLFFWSLGQLAISFFWQTSIFQFHLHTLFYLVLLIMSIVHIIYWRRRMSSHTGDESGGFRI